jgi:hypothetical protein
MEGRGITDLSATFVQKTTENIAVYNFKHRMWTQILADEWTSSTILDTLGDRLWVARWIDGLGSYFLTFSIASWAAEPVVQMEEEPVAAR